MISELRPEAGPSIRAFAPSSSEAVMKRRIRALALAAAVMALVASSVGWVVLGWVFAGNTRRPALNIPKIVKPELPALEYLDAGLKVGDVAPEGWTQLVTKPILRLSSGDVNTLPSASKSTATKFRTVIAASVTRGGPGVGYSLRKVGLGLCAAREHGDEVVSSDQLKQQKVSLSILENLVMQRAEKTLARGRLAARTATFALLDTFVELTEGEKHVSVILRHALVANPATGELLTFIWTIPESTGARKPVEEMVELPSPCVYDCPIHVVAHRLLGKLPVNWGFAMESLPKGNKLAMPPELSSLATIDSWTDDQARQFESRIKETLAKPGGTR